MVRHRRRLFKEQSEKIPMARTVHASFTKIQALLGPGATSPKASTISSWRGKEGK
jgi:hypothetical protein